MEAVICALDGGEEVAKIVLECTRFAAAASIQQAVDNSVEKLCGKACDGRLIPVA
jgi:hypothetical protein